MEITEQSVEIAGQPAFWLQAQPQTTPEPVLYLHGVPTSSEIWRDFLQRTGGYALDLPGLGRSGKRGDLPYDPAWLADRVLDFIDDRELQRLRLVGQDWGGAVGLIAAQQIPERITRLVVIDAVPLFADYRWHWVAQLWRRRGLGELLMGASTRMTMRTLTRQANATKGPMPDRFVEDVMRFFDVGTQRAILKLYRSADPEVLGRLGAGLHTITCPALVAWGEQDPYCPPRFAQAYADALGGPTEVLPVPDAGHWPWYDQPWLIDRVAEFVAG